MGVKKSAVCRSRPPPNGMNPASSRVSIPLTKPSTDPGASPLSACSRSPGANLEAQPAFVEYFVSLMRVRSSIAAEYTSAPPRGLRAREAEQAPGSSTCPQHMLPGRHAGFQPHSYFSTHFLLDKSDVVLAGAAADCNEELPIQVFLDSGGGLRYARNG
jgi:hypothetical protein